MQVFYLRQQPIQNENQYVPYLLPDPVSYKDHHFSKQKTQHFQVLVLNTEGCVSQANDEARKRFLQAGSLATFNTTLFLI